MIDRALRRHRQMAYRLKHLRLIRRWAAKTPDTASRWHMTPEDVARMARRSATVHGSCCKAHQNPRYQRVPWPPEEA